MLQLPGIHGSPPNGELYSLGLFEAIQYSPQQPALFQSNRRSSEIDNQDTGISRRLPSLKEFDREVEVLARAHQRLNPYPSPSPSPSPWLSGNQETMESIELLSDVHPLNRSTDRPVQGLTSRYFPNHQAQTTKLSEGTLAADRCMENIRRRFFTPSSYHDHDARTKAAAEAFWRAAYCYRTPSPDGKSPHAKSPHGNLQYTLEEGDFIIYARHDQRMKWLCIEEEFARRFGQTPRRTIHGLQAWHYRMNKSIPVCDEAGLLCFDNDEDLEPRHMSIKCRDRNGGLNDMGIPGIAERYPERAMNYEWVDEATRLKARHWADKRALQYTLREQRRRRQSRWMIG
ncbi:hypothetical protein DER45DRAFT_632131 [Fusarium avenaceum]|nr:hypothetical protein DER45DRAFT_632131 [Fusarium avenaceum]